MCKIINELFWFTFNDPQLLTVKPNVQKRTNTFFNFFCIQDAHRIQCFQKYNAPADKTNAVGYEADRFDCAIVCANGDNVGFSSRL